MPSAPAFSLALYSSMAWAVSLDPPPVMIFAPAGRDVFADLDETELLRVGERRGLTRGARDDDTVRAGADDVVDVLLDGGPIDLAVGRHRGDERDEHLTEGVAGVRHALRLSVRSALPPVLRPRWVNIVRRGSDRHTGSP